MLHLELCGKLREENRNEDSLTSTVFGTLFIANATELLVDWLRCAVRLDSVGHQTTDRLEFGPGTIDYWFWPRFRGTTPDLLLRVGEDLFIIEAKYRSSKSNVEEHRSKQDGATGEMKDTRPVDQLLRQWQAASADAPSAPFYDPDVHLALRECQRHLIYLVSARTPRATSVKEVVESQEEIAARTGAEVPVWMLTWEDLHRLLVRTIRKGSSARWARELAAVLSESRSLGAFVGFAETPLPAADINRHTEQWAESWRRQQESRSFDWVGAFEGTSPVSLALIESWGLGWQQMRRQG